MNENPGGGNEAASHIEAAARRNRFARSSREPAFLQRLTEEFIEGIRAGKCDDQMRRIHKAIADREFELLNGPQEED